MGTSKRTTRRTVRVQSGDVANDGCAYVHANLLEGARAGELVALYSGDGVVADGEVLKVVGSVVRIAILGDGWRLGTQPPNV